MYKIITSNNETFITEKITYVRKHKSGAFLITDKDRAEGVGYHGNFYLFSEGNQFHEFDGADELKSLRAENESLKEQIVNAEEALIELYESMEVATNG